MLKTFVVIVVALAGQCLLKPAINISSAFQVGKERTYTFSSDVQINDVVSVDSVVPPYSYRVTGMVRAGAIWGTDELKLLKFTLVAPRLHVPNKRNVHAEQKSHLNTAVNKEFYARWQLGTITAIYVHAKEDPSLINMKKAIVSLFQYQLLDGEYDETDVSGICRVVYTTTRSSVTTVEKVKRMCERNAEHRYTRQDAAAIGVRESAERSAVIKVTNDGTLEKVDGKEMHQFAMVANPSEGFKLESTISLRFDGSISNIAALNVPTIEEAVATIKGCRKQSLLTDTTIPYRRKQQIKLSEAVKTYRDDLADDKIGTHTGATAMLNVLNAARETNDKAEILKAFTGNKNKAIMGQLLDVLAATQTVHTHAAAKELLKLDSSKPTDDDHTERYLQGLAVGRRPRIEVIADLLNITKTNANILPVKITDTLTQTIASMSRHLQQPNSPIVRQVRDHLVDRLSAKNAKQEEKLICLRALQNIQLVETIPLLMVHVAGGQPNEPRAISVAAMKALRAYPVATTWAATATPSSSAYRRQFADIFYQRIGRFDSSVRTMALDILLELRPTVAELTEMLQHLRSGDRSVEVKQYLWQQIQMLADRCQRFRSMVRAVLAAHPELNNYHVIGGQRGISTVLERTFSRAPPTSFNMTLLSVQEMYAGALKRGLVDMSIEAAGDREKFSVFTLGLYASGISSFAGAASADDDDDGGDDEPSTGGMEVTVQGAYFRPLQFFGSKSELTGLVFSGGATSPTPAYTATTVLQDHEDVIRLQTGASVRLNVLGAISINLYGQTEISLWYQTAQCDVNKESGMTLTGSYAVDTSFVQLQANFATNQQPTLQLKSSFEMPSVLCLELTQPETMLERSVNKKLQIPGSGYVKSARRVYRYKMAGYTHALNQKNN